MNLLSEAFNHVVHIHNEVSIPKYLSDDSNGAGYLGSYKELWKKWPDCQTVIQNAIKRKEKLIKKPVEVVMLKLFTSARPHLQLFQEHRDHILRECSPLLHGLNGDQGIRGIPNPLLPRKERVLLLVLCHLP